jgi:hypothetical protein
LEKIGKKGKTPWFWRFSQGTMEFSEGTLEITRARGLLGKALQDLGVTYKTLEFFWT